MRKIFRRHRHVIVLSDATGRTAQMLVESALAQFQDTRVDLEVVPNVRAAEQIPEIMRRARLLEAVVIYTLVSSEMRQKVMEEGMNHGVPTVDTLGPILTRLSDLLEISPLARPGIYRGPLGRDYFRRIEAMDFTVKHDDGAGLPSLGEAEIVLVGVSRASKTPLSIYLSYRGWKAANVPVVTGLPLPVELDQVDPLRVVGLTVNPQMLRLIRLERQSHLGAGELDDYTSARDVQKEVTYGLRLFRHRGWPVVDTTNKSIEESATEVMRLLYARLGERKDPLSEEGDVPTLDDSQP